MSRKFVFVQDQQQIIYGNIQSLILFALFQILCNSLQRVLTYPPMSYLCTHLQAMQLVKESKTPRKTRNFIPTRSHPRGTGGV